ncbi:tandem-95 repeat protein, partial [Sphingobacterium nematocida]
MKGTIQRTIAVCTILVSALTAGYAQNVNIPDANFKNALLNHFPVINTDGDGEISLAEAAAFIGNIDVANKQIADLTGINAFVNVTSLSCYLNQLTALDIRLNTKLTFLACDRNKLTALDVSQNRDLGTLWCHTNPLGVLDVTQNTKLTQLACTSNQLTHLDLTKNVDLGILHCNTNELTVLDLSKNTKLTYLSTYLNQLTTLDVSKNTALTQLYCDRNQLTALDVSLNTKLVYLWCHTNRLTSLDLSKNTALTDLLCHTNRLAILNLKNGNNMSIPNANFDIRYNPNLTCVAVDNAVWSTANWIGKDAQTSYSVQCANNAPVINGLNGDSAAWPGAGNSVTLDVGGNATVSDAEMDALNGGLGNYNGASLVVERAGGTPLSMDIIDFNTSGALFSVQGSSLQSNGLTFATYMQVGGVLTINFNSSGTIATNALVNEVLRRITYRNDTPAGDAVFKFTFSDGVASTTANVTVTSDFIYITKPKDTPTINLADGVSFSEAVAMAAADATGAQTLVFTSIMSGTMTLAGSLSINESLTINADAAPNLVITGSTITLGAGTTLSLTNTSGTVEIASTIAGAGSLGKTGNGTLSLTSNNNNTNWTGSLSVTGGILVVRYGIQLSRGNLMLDNGTILLTVPESNTVPVSNTVLLGSNGGTIQVNGAGTASFTEVVSGGKLRKTGGGTLLLFSDGNTYGSTDVLNGTLHVNTDADLGSGAITMANGTTLLINSATTIDNNIALDGSATIGSRANSTLSGLLSGTGTLTKTGSGILTLSGTNSHSGAVSLTAGGLTLSGGSSVHDTAPVNLSAATTLTISTAETIGSLAGSGNVLLNASLSTGGNNTSTTFSGVISGVSNLVKAGSGTFSLTGTNTYAGSTTISAGTLQLRGGSAIPDDSPVSVAAGALLELFDSPETIGSLAGAGNVSLNGNKLSAGKDNSSTVFSGIISGAGALSKNGTGTWTLSGANRYIGGTTLAGGELIANNNSALGTGMVSVSSPATLGTTVEGTTLANLFSLGANATIRNDVSMTLSNAIQGVGALSKTGTGTLTLSGSNGYMGGTTLAGGTLIANDHNALGTGTVNMGVGAILGTTVEGTTLANLFSLGANATIRNDVSMTLSNAIQGVGGLTKMGTGTLTLSDDNGYLGATIVSAGRLVVDGKLNETILVYVAPGATLAGNGEIFKNGSNYKLFVETGGVLSPGNSPGILTVNGNLQMKSGSTLAIEINGVTPGTGYDQVVVNGGVDISDASLAVTHGYAALNGQQYTIITNDASDAVTGTFSGLAEGSTLTAGGNGTVLTSSYTGGTGNDFTLTAPVNTAPTNIILSGTTVNENVAPNTTVGTLSTTDADQGDTFTYSFVAGTGSTDNASFSILGNSLNINASPDYETKTSYSVRIRSTDSYGATFEKVFLITVLDLNSPPVLAPIYNHIVYEGSMLTFTAKATDDGEPNGTLTFSLVDAPEGARIDAVSGVFIWTPTEAQGPNSYTFDVVVSDGKLTDEQTITVTVMEVNTAPVLVTIGHKIVDEESLLTFEVVGTDSDLPANTLRYSLVGEPTGASIDPVTGVFTWIPTEAQGPRTYTFKVRLSDGLLYDEKEIKVTVNEVNVAPVAKNDSYFTDEDTPLIIAAPGLLANDTDSDSPAQTLIAETVLPPAKGTLTLNANGSFTYIPNANFYGADSFRYWISDGSLWSNIATVTITVNPVNDAPTINGTPATTVDQDVVYSFIPTASDVDGDALTFSINNKPTWATFNTATGELTGTPSNADVGTTMGIVISVSDGSLSASLPVFTITIVNVNDGPIISGIPATSVNQDAVY